MNHLANGKKLRIALTGIGLAALLSSAIGCGIGTMQANSGLSVSGGQGTAMQGSAHGGNQAITGATVKLFAAGTSGYGAGASAITLSKTVTTSDGTGVAINGYSIATSVATFTAANSFTAGNTVTLNGFPVSSNSLNGQTVVVLPTGLSGTQFETAITGADTTSADAGTANLSTNTNANAGNVYNTLQPGGFTITGDYTCPTVVGGSQVYIVITGGNPGITPSVGNTVAGNPNLALMTAIGACGSGGTLSSVPFVAIDEYSTVAAVAALQQFMAVPASGNALAPVIGAPSTTDGGYSIGVQGLINSFNMVPNLSDLGTGAAPLATSQAAINGATPEATKIGLIANILASCVNSGVSGTALPLTGPSTPCSTLFTDAMPAGASTAPTDTIQAAWYILRSTSYFGSAANGGFYTTGGTATSNVSAYTTYVNNLVALSTPQPIYPAVSSAKDFTVAVSFAPTYNSGTYAVNIPNYISIDQYGNAWVVNHGATASVAELSPSGTVIMTPATTFTASATGGAVGQTGFVAPASNVRTLTTPFTLAIDTGGSVWVPNFGDAVSTPIAGSIGIFAGSTAAGVGSSGASGGFYTGGLPFMAAIDGSNNVYLTIAGNSSSADVSEKTLEKFTSSGTYSQSNRSASASSSLISSSTAGSLFIALDNNTNNGPYVWISESNGCKPTGSASGGQYGALDQFSELLAVAPTATYVGANGAGLGTGSNACTPTNGYNTTIAANTSTPYSVAVDRYNNVWMADDYASASGTVSGFDGVTYMLQNTLLNTTPTSSTGTVGTTAASSASYADSSTLAAGTNVKKPFFLAVDGNNNLWIANNSLSSVSEAAYAGSTTGVVLESPTGGYAHGNFDNPEGIAIDPSGNIWVTSTSTSSTYTPQTGTGTIPEGNAVTVILGAAAPTVTPLSVALEANKVGQLP